MKIFFIIGIIILNIIIHELAHALAMIKNGVDVEEIGIGFKVRFIPHFAKKCEVTLKNNKKCCFNLVLSPLLLGAYVKPANDKEIEALSYKQKTLILGAGVVANLIFGFVLLIPFTIISALSLPVAVDIFRVILICSIAALIALLLFKWGRYFSMVMPLFSIALTAFIGWSIIKAGVGGTMVGPVGIVAIANKTQSFLEIFWLGIAISWGIGMVNMLPLFPLDGGLILFSFLEKCLGKKKWLHGLFRAVSMIIFLLLIVVVWYSDFARL